MGDHEAKPIQHWAHALGIKVAQKAKAFVAGIGALLVGELVVLLADPTVLGQVNTVVPPELAPYVPVVAALFVGLLTHAIPNRPAEAQPPSE